MLARLLFAAVALPLIGALPDAHASRAASAADAAPALSARAPAAGSAVLRAAPPPALAPARPAR